jgi:hypothetical protein
VLVHDWLVVTALGVESLLELELSSVEPDDVENVSSLLLVVVSSFAVDDVDVPVSLDVVLVFVFAELVLSPGSWPVTSCPKTTPHAATNVAVAAAIARLRMRRLRARCCWRRCRPRAFAASRSAGGGKSSMSGIYGHAAWDGLGEV